MTTPQSEVLKSAIARNRQTIAAHKVQIGQLAAQAGPRVNRFAVDEQISGLQQQIRGMEQVIESLEHRLPRQIEIDRVSAAIEANIQAQEQQRLADDAAAHLQAVQSSAREQFLQVPGQTAESFNLAWPAISQQIATQRATAAGAAETANTHHGNPLAQAAADVMKAKYGALSVAPPSGNLVQLEPA